MGDAEVILAGDEEVSADFSGETDVGVFGATGRITAYVCMYVCMCVHMHIQMIYAKEIFCTHKHT